MDRRDKLHNPRREFWIGLLSAAVHAVPRVPANRESPSISPAARSVDFTDTSITQNTRGAYPIEFIRSAKIPCVAGRPTDVIFLTCEAFGVLPPVSFLSPAHAMYHFKTYEDGAAAEVRAAGPA